MKKYKVGIIGATGMVGQRFVLLTANHPWFTPVVLAASAHSAGKTYAQAIEGKWHMAEPIPESVKSMIVMDAEADAEEIARQVDFVFCAVNMKKDEIKALEEKYAKLECPVVSNNSAHRHTPDVPMVVPEINADHIRIIDAQRKRLGTKRGFIAVKSNCSLQSYVPALHPLMKYGVEKALGQGVAAGRTQVARIVGRDTQDLSEEEIIKATVETVSENTTDGVISPLLYAAIGGPILLWGFKAASTLDSMVGYLDEKYRDIGWSSARLDDVLNYIPARLTALLMVIASYLIGLDGKNAFRIVRRDHANHKSPNCAWSESAAAGALHIQLGGTHNYFGKPVEKPTIGDADRPAERADIRRANRLLYTSSLLMMVLIVLIAIVR